MYNLNLYNKIKCTIIQLSDLTKDVYFISPINDPDLSHTMHLALLI